MFVELYRTQFEYDNGPTENPTDIGVVSANVVINVEMIVSMCMVPTEINGTKLHRVRIAKTAEADDEPYVGKLYITDHNYERLIH